MILVSLFSEDNVQFDKIKTCYIFEYQSNENRTSFGGTPGIINCKHGKHKVFAQPPVCYARMTVIRATRRVFHECEWGGKKTSFWIAIQIARNLFLGTEARHYKGRPRMKPLLTVAIAMELQPHAIADIVRMGAQVAIRTLASFGLKRWVPVYHQHSLERAHRQVLKA